MYDYDLLNHIEEATESLKVLILDFYQNPLEKYKKKSMILSYWVKTYVEFIRKEKTFNPENLIKYKRGSIIKVDFGFRIGNELGGEHYAVVLDNKNSLSSGILTVVPLLSLKENYVQNRYTVKLADGLISPLLFKLTEMMSEVNKQYEQVEANKTSDNQDNSILIDKLIRGIKELQSFVYEVQRLNGGSVANVCQITTISKIRIKEPINNKQLLYGIRISNRDLDSIQSHLEKLFLYGNNY